MKILSITREKILFLFILSFLFQRYYLSIGFSFKAFYAVAVLVLFSFFYKIKIHKTYWYEKSLLMFYVVYSITGLWAEYPVDSMRLILGILLFIFVYFLFRNEIIRVDEKKLNKFIFQIGIVFNLLSLLMYIAGTLIVLKSMSAYNDQKVFGVLVDRMIPRLIGITKDPNFFVLFNSLFFFNFFCKWKSSIKYKYGFVLTLLTMLLTFSRGGILAILASLFFFYIFIDKRLLKFIYLLLPVGSVLILLYFQFPILSEMVDRRLSTASSGSGRFEIWGNGLELFLQHPTGGIGLFNFLPYNIKLFNDAHYMHNTYLDVLVEGGVISAIFYLFFIYILFSTLWKVSKSDVNARYLLLSFISCFILILSLSAIITEIFILQYALLFYFIEKKRIATQLNIAKS